MSDRFKLFFALLIAACVAGAIWGQGLGSNVRRLSFLAVGQGDCTVWQDGDAVILIDAGPKSREGFDAGDRIVLPKLRRMGIKDVSVIVITHPDSDHIGGLGALAKRFKDAKIVASAGFRDDEDMQWWLKEAKVDPSRLVWIEDRTRIKLEHSTVELAAPVITPGTSNNDGSLFVRIEHGAGSAVLTGDASTDTEERMQRRLKWTAQVLKVGHHGSRTSTSEAFVRALGPEWGVISCGRENRFDHPHRSVVEVLERQKVDLFRTDLQGDVVFDVWAEGFAPAQIPLPAK